MGGRERKRVRGRGWEGEKKSEKVGGREGGREFIKWVYCMQLSSAPEDTVTSLSSSIPAILQTASEAMDRCRLLTEGCGAVGLVRALEVCG